MSARVAHRVRTCDLPGAVAARGVVFVRHHHGTAVLVQRRYRGIRVQTAGHCFRQTYRLSGRVRRPRARQFRSRVVSAAHHLHLSGGGTAVADDERAPVLPVAVAVVLTSLVFNGNTNITPAVRGVHRLNLLCREQLALGIFDGIAGVLTSNVGDCAIKGQCRRTHRVCISPLFLVTCTVGAVLGFIFIYNTAATGRCCDIVSSRG